MPASASASVWAATPAAVAGAIAPARMNGVMIDAWLAVGVDLGGVEHRVVPHQRRRGIDQAGHHRPVVEIAAEGDSGHLDRVDGPFGRRDRPHERLVAVPEVGVHHVEVTLADRHVDGLADGAAGVVEVGRQVGELHEVLEVGEGRVAAALVEVVHER